jgi:hypothetical protein
VVDTAIGADTAIGVDTVAMKAPTAATTITNPALSS